MKALLPGETPGWGGAGRAMAALLLEFQGPQQAPLAGTQAPGAGAGKVALASWVLASSNLQARPLWCSSSSAGRCPPGPALEAQDGASAHCPVDSLGPGFPGASISHPQLGQRSERWDGGREGRASLRGSCCSLRTSGPQPGLPGWPPTPDSDHTPQEAPAVSGGAADGPPPPPHLCPPSCVPAVVLSLLGASELHSEASSLDTGSGRVGQIAERATGHGFTPRPTPEAGPAPPLRLTPPHPQYGIVLDAGSSHTAMFIYKWPADKENDTGIVGQHSSCDVRGKSPLSAGRPRPTCPLTVGPREPSLVSASADSSQQTPLLGARGPLWAGAAGVPPEGGCIPGPRKGCGQFLEKKPQGTSGRFGPCLAQDWLYIPGRAGGVPRSWWAHPGRPLGRPGWVGTLSALSEHLCAYPLGRWRLADRGWPQAALLSVSRRL